MPFDPSYRPPEPTFDPSFRPDEPVERPRIDVSDLLNARLPGRQRQLQISQLPSIPKDVTTLSPAEGEDIIKQYDTLGIDHGIEIFSGYGRKESREKKVIPRRPALGVGRKSSKQEQDEIRKAVDDAYSDTHPGETNVFEQFVEAMIRPNAQMALAVAGDPNFEETEKGMLGHKYIPFERLSAEQKTAAFVGGALGYMGPGAIAHTTAKGLVKFVLKSETLEALGRESAKKILTKVDKVAISKMSPGKLKDYAGLYANKFIKGGGQAATEGAIFEGLLTGGDPERMIEGAVAFSILAPAIGAGIALKGGKEVPSAGTRAMKTAGGVTKSEAAPAATRPVEGIDSLFKPKPQANTRMAPNIEQYHALVKKTFKEDQSAIDKLLDEPVELALLSKEDQWLYRSKLLIEMAKENSIRETRIDVTKAKVSVAINKESNKLGPLDKQEASIQKKIVKTMSAIAQSKDLSIVSDAPETVEALKLSFAGKAMIKEAYGTLKNMSRGLDATGREEMMRRGKEAGLNLRQSMRVTDQVLNPTSSFQKLTPTQKITVARKSDRLSRLESSLKQVNGRQAKIQTNLLRMKGHAFYDKDAIIALAKTGMEEGETQIRFLDKLERMGLYNAEFDSIPKIKIFGKDIMSVTRIIAQTEKFNYWQVQTGVPVGELPLKFVQSKMVRDHLKKELAAEFRPDKTMKALSKLKRKGQSEESLGKELMKMMHYVHQKPGSSEVIWNPKAIAKGTKGAIYVPEYVGEAPSGETLEHLFNLPN